MHTAVRGRVRLRLPALRGDIGLKRALEAGLGGDGIRFAAASSATGTVLILYDPARKLPEIERRVRRIAALRPAPEAAYVASDGRAWHSLDAERVLEALDSSPRGLSATRARRLRRRYGANLLLGTVRRSGFELLLGQFRNLPTALLTATALLSLATGGVFDGVVVLAVIILNGLVGFAAEGWSEHAITSLEKDGAPVARVRRDGVELIIAADELVPGDVIALRRDEPVPADARLIESDRLAVNEASLTGESLPVTKAVNVLAAGRAPLAERRNMLYRGTVVTGGSGRAVVVATGDRTEISRIQAALGSAMRPQTPLQHQLDELGRLLVLGAGLASGLMLLVGVLRGHRMVLVLRSAISLGVAAVPEGLPTMVTTALAVNARRLLRSGLLVRRFEAIEALGTVQLVCFDKTGTLTLNRMTVTRLVWNGRRATLDGADYRGADGNPLSAQDDPDLRRLCEICVLCNDAAQMSAGGLDGSATEIALLGAATALGLDWQTQRSRQPRLSVIERAEGRRYMATVHRAEGGRRLVAVKGDPLAVLPLCSARAEAGELRPLDAAARDAIVAENLQLAEGGLRVLGVAYRLVEPDDAIGEPARDLVWLGLVGMADRIRRGAAELVRGLQRAGIATAMLTGDQRATALSIAVEAGLAPDGRIELIEGDRLDEGSLTDGAHRIYARLAPAQKLQVVAGLQRAGLRVAMIGDGVNDTPALKAADVGITLAASATAVARDIADIVLVGDDLAPLLGAFAAGRAVRDNVRRGVRFLVATNLSEILLMLFATATGLARPLTPAQLLWINLVSDVLPAIGLALTPPTDDLMAGPLADAAAPTMAIAGETPGLVADAAVLAGSAVAAEAWVASRSGGRTGAAAGFASLMTSQLLYALACRDDPLQRPDPVLGGLLGLSFATAATALFLPGLRTISGASLGIANLSISTGAALLPLLVSGVRQLPANARPPASSPPRR